MWKQPYCGGLSSEYYHCLQCTGLGWCLPCKYHRGVKHHRLRFSNVNDFQKPPLMYYQWEKPPRIFILEVCWSIALCFGRCFCSQVPKAEACHKSHGTVRTVASLQGVLSTVVNSSGSISTKKKAARPNWWSLLIFGWNNLCRAGKNILVYNERKITQRWECSVIFIWCWC